MKSIRTDPTVHAVQGDERIRTAARFVTDDSVYESHWYVRAWEGNFQRWNNPVVRERARQSLERVLRAKRGVAS